MSRLPRVLIQRDFLNAADHARLLDESLRVEDDYVPSSIFKYTDDMDDIAIGKDNKTRKSLVRQLPKDQAKLIKDKVLSCSDRIEAEIGVSFPSECKFEIEAVQNGDGAFFATHTDTTRGPLATRRVISAVYYYSKNPRVFSGGELKLYSLDRSASICVEPEDNSIVFFSSMFAHEVLPVSLKTGAFGDGRFSVNCWVHKVI